MINSIILAEDNLEQCLLFRKALKEIAPQTSYHEVNDGDALLSLLKNFHPDLVFIDLNLPCKSGVQCIKEIRDNKHFDNLPIVVFTISAQNSAIQTAYGFGATLYIIKPDDYLKLVEVLRSVLAMDWTDSKSITQNHFHFNGYQPFDDAANA